MKPTLLAALRLCVGLCLLSSAICLQPGCSTPPSARVAQVQTLKAVGHTAEAAVELSARLYRDGRITSAQARQVMDFYDQKFQPVYRVAVTAAQSNLDSLASPDLANLAAELSTLVMQFQSKPSP